MILQPTEPLAQGWQFNFTSVCTQEDSKDARYTNAVQTRTRILAEPTPLSAKYYIACSAATGRNASLGARRPALTHRALWRDGNALTKWPHASVEHLKSSVTEKLNVFVSY